MLEPGRIFGLTITDITREEAIFTALNALELPPAKTKLRVVTDWGMAPSYYAHFVERAAAEGYGVMLLVADSSVLKKYSVGTLTARGMRYAKRFRTQLWTMECGNEISGERGTPASQWPGAGAYQKTKALLEVAAAYGIETAVTYYLSPGDSVWLVEWIKAHPLTASLYLLSTYPRTAERWQSVDWNASLIPFQEALPKGSLFGWGETGTEDGDGKQSMELWEPILSHFYQFYYGSSNFVGGTFAWDFVEHCLPTGTTHGKPLFPEAWKLVKLLADWFKASKP